MSSADLPSKLTISTLIDLQIGTVGLSVGSNEGDSVGLYSKHVLVNGVVVIKCVFS